jgi:hypothetical protein
VVASYAGGKRPVSECERLGVRRPWPTAVVRRDAKGRITGSWAQCVVPGEDRPNLNSTPISFTRGAKTHD